MIVFQGAPGSVVALRDGGVQGDARVISLLQADRLHFGVTRSIITRLTVTQEANLQFLHTLGSHVYIYVFGDRMGTVGLSGFTFNRSCDQPGQQLDTGPARMLAWYEQNRTSRRRSPLRFMVGNRPIEGFVVGLNIDVVDPASLLVQWSVTMRSLPAE